MRNLAQQGLLDEDQYPIKTTFGGAQKILAERYLSQKQFSPHTFAKAASADGLASKQLGPEKYL